VPFYEVSLNKDGISTGGYADSGAEEPIQSHTTATK
jgi:hypothetical protein